MAGHGELITYLWDVSSAELLCQNLEEEIAALQQDAARCRAALERKPLEAEKPEPITYHPDAGVTMFLLLGVLSLTALLLLSLNWMQKLFALAMGGFWLCGGAEVWWEEQRKLDRAFQERTAAYESLCQYNAGLQTEALRLKAKIEENSLEQEKLSHSLKEAEALRRELYEAGQIPPDFRSCTAVCYLYLAASTGHEMDLTQLTRDLQPGQVRSCMEDYLSPDWENMLTCRWEQALWEKNQGEEGENPQHRRLNDLLLTTEC